MTRKKLLQKRRSRRVDPRALAQELHYENLLLDYFIKSEKGKGETVAAAHPSVKRSFSPSHGASGDIHGTLPKRS